MTPLQKSILSALIRHLLTALSGVLVAREIITADQSMTFVQEATNLVLPFLPAIASFIWSTVHKTKVDQRIAEGHL